MDDDQQFCLRWNNHQSTLISVFDTLLENGTLVDCTLAAEGKFLKAHKVVLSACSPYFAALLSQQYDKHPIFILKDIKFQELRAMMDYMYRGEVNISQDQLAALLKAAESLQIKGLSESRGGSTQKNENVVQKQPVPVVSKSGLTIEHKRPANKHPTSAATESDVSMSREGSTSPTSRKRKKFRRRSIEVNNMDNHDQLSNSSSQSQSIHMTSIPMTAASQITSATSAANVLNVTKKTDHHDSKKDMEQSQADDDEDDDKNDLEPPAQRQKHDMDVSHIKEKMQSTHSELLIEPKNEYDDGQDETVEDLTLDDEELLEDLDQAGPSHGGEGSSQGYAQWQVGQNQDEVFLAAQEAAGQHRDAQGQSNKDDSLPFTWSTTTRPAQNSILIGPAFTHVTMADLMTELRNLDNKLTSGLKGIEYQIKLQRRICDDGKPLKEPFSQTITETELIFDFPINKSEDLIYFLDSLNDKHYRDVMLARCKQLGGVTSAKMVRNIWKFLFSPDIQKLLNWSGQNDKIRIENSKLFSLVEGATLQMFPTTTLNKISDITKIYFQNVKTRLKKKNYESADEIDNC
ncbi:longitudinals lacking protein, isoforms H/M/V isoform X4 [Bradysia coprophila]|uniref:longitudinals lacking protein, isoforms H/M/V isoform X4 n=1 Tax=Bradysia coprophila TaxID=38358 RepID=UPI00187D9FC2|nr:longitudinals lacking protein, isoforms H/M/V isoform X4 [Bradysia coprophila]